MDICSNGDTLSIIRLVILVINLIRIIGPIALLIMVGIDIFKSVSGGEKELNELIPTAAKRIIAAIVIFLVPLIVSLIMSLVSSNTLYPCIKNATKDNIQKAYIDTANNAIEKAYSSLDNSDYTLALQSIYKINDVNIQKELETKLDDYRNIVIANNLITTVEYLKTKDSYNNALEAINKIKTQKIKAEYTTRLNKIEIIEYSNSTMPTPVGNPLNINSSFNWYNDFKVNNIAGYYLYIPENATTNMPIIVVLPPNSLSGPTEKKVVQTKSLKNVKAFIYIPVAAGSSSSSPTQWGTRHSRSAVIQLNSIVDKYKIDKSRISLTGFSSSAYSIYWTANTYRIFSAVVPVSSGMSISGVKNYNDWQYLKTISMKGFGEKGGKTTADGRSCLKAGYVNWSANTAMTGVFKELGKIDDYTYLPNVCHGEMGKYVFEIDNNKNGISDIIEWMVSQKKQ